MPVGSNMRCPMSLVRRLWLALALLVAIGPSASAQTTEAVDAVTAALRVLQHLQPPEPVSVERSVVAGVRQGDQPAAAAVVAIRRAPDFLRDGAVMVRFREPSAVAIVALGVLLGTHVSTSDETNELRPAADRLSPLPVAAVTLRDGFWAPRQEVNRTRTLDHVLKEIESTGGLSNFDIAAGKATGSSAARSGPIRTSTSGSKAHRGRWPNILTRHSTPSWTPSSRVSPRRSSRTATWTPSSRSTFRT